MISKREMLQYLIHRLEFFDEKIRMHTEEGPPWQVERCENLRLEVKIAIGVLTGTVDVDSPLANPKSSWDMFRDPEMTRARRARAA